MINDTLTYIYIDIFLADICMMRYYQRAEGERKVFYYHGKATQLKILTGSGEESR